MAQPRSSLVQASFDSASVNAEVEFRLLRPDDWSEGERLPLILHLHGAMSSAASLELARPFYDQLWTSGELPRAVVACPSTPTMGGFYIDWPDASWETLVAHEFPEQLASPTATAVIGASMGGYGALKLAFAEPERFAAVAALSPAVFPAEMPNDVPDRTIPSVLGSLHEAMSGGTGDAATYAANSVQGRARAQADRIREASLPIWFDCGAADEFLLYEGAEYLHHLLVELDVPHEFRLVEGAGHLGPATDERTLEAIRFIGRALSLRRADRG